MFKFLKDKLKKAVSIFSKKVEKEAEIKQEVKEVPEEEIKEPKLKEKVKEDLRETEEEIKELEKEKPELTAEEEKEEEKPIEEEIKEEIEEELKEEIKKEEPVKKEKEPEEVLAEEISKAELLSYRKPERFSEFKNQRFLYAKDESLSKPEEKEEVVLEESPEAEIAEIEEKIWEEEEEKEKAKEEKPKKSFFQKLFGKKEKKKEEVKEVKKEIKEEKKEEVKEKKPVKEVKEKVKPKVEEAEKPKEKKGLFKKIKETFTTIKLSEDKFEKLFWELEVVLLENNVAVDVIDKIKADLKAELTTGKVSRKGVYELIEDSLRESVEGLFMDQHFNLIEEIKKKKEKPYVIAFIGVNGSGKTTTMAKVAHLLMKNKLSVVFAASDTFRAAAIQQLQEHADKLGVKMIKHDYESDPAAVAFDAVKHAKAKSIDVVMIDTAGRLHSNDNLMNELKKLVRVNKPDLKIFVGESITGNDCIEQARLFNEAVGIDVIILAKADVDEKGGAAVSVSYVTKKPIIYLGTGQKYRDLTEFKPEIVIRNIGL